jgi:hypothetical protein
VNPETYAGNFGPSCVFCHMNDICLVQCGVNDGGIQAPCVARASRVCTNCCGGAVADEMHIIFESPAIHTVGQQYAPLFSTNTDTIRSCVAKEDHVQVFNCVLSWLGVTAETKCNSAINTIVACYWLGAEGHARPEQQSLTDKCPSCSDLTKHVYPGRILTGMML